MTDYLSYLFLEISHFYTIFLLFPHFLTIDVV